MGQAGLRLALTGAIKDAVLDIRELASYLLYVLNSRKAHDYVEKFGLDGPSDDITTVLQAVGLRMGYRISRKAAEMQGVADRTDTQDWVHFDLDKSATALVRLYRYCNPSATTRLRRACGSLIFDLFHGVIPA